MLRAAAQGEVPVTLSPERNPVGVLKFTEPNLAFSSSAREGEHLVLRVHLALESTSERPWPKEREQYKGLYSPRILTLPLGTSSQDLLDTAGAWQDDLAFFPYRPSSH